MVNVNLCNFSQKQNKMKEKMVDSWRSIWKLRRKIYKNLSALSPRVKTDGFVNKYIKYIASLAFVWQYWFLSSTKYNRGWCMSIFSLNICILTVHYLPLVSSYMVTLLLYCYMRYTYDLKCMEYCTAIMIGGIIHQQLKFVPQF